MPCDDLTGSGIPTVQAGPRGPVPMPSARAAAGTKPSIGGHSKPPKEEHPVCCPPPPSWAGPGQCPSLQGSRLSHLQGLLGAMGAPGRGKRGGSERLLGVGVLWVPGRSARARLNTGFQPGGQGVTL